MLRRPAVPPVRPTLDVTSTPMPDPDVIHPETRRLLDAVSLGGYELATVQRTALLMIERPLEELDDAGRAALVSFWALVARVRPEVIDPAKLEQALDAVEAQHPDAARAREVLITRISQAIVRDEDRQVRRRKRRWEDVAREARRRMAANVRPGT